MQQQYTASIFFVSILTITFTLCVYAQPQLKPGFDAEEYLALLSLNFYGNSIADSNVRKTQKDVYTKLYTSPEVGLKNQWSLYLREDNVAAITVRGTVASPVSWSANFYAAMIAAQGTLQLNDTTRFSYKLAADKQAYVHVGWTVALASMAPDIVAKIKDLYGKGVRHFYLSGHSQGGAITYLLRSYLYYLQQDGTLPNDIVFKTYCSAAPKPGNMFYAYDYEFINRGGWAFTVVNRSDWVPESPYTIQRLQDMNDLNPLIHTKSLLKKQSLLVRIVGGALYNKLYRKPRKAQEVYTHYLGKVLYKKSINKELKDFKEPEYVASVNYMRAGTPIVLMPDEEYHQIFKEKGSEFKDYFVHHQFDAYYLLIKKQYLNQ